MNATTPTTLTEIEFIDTREFDGSAKVKDLMITTQLYENYGAHNWDGEGECPQYWKAKGGEDYIVTNVPGDIDYAAVVRIVNAANDRLKIVHDGNYFRQHILYVSLFDVGVQTEFEQNQLEFSGEIRFAATRLAYSEL